VPDRWRCDLFGKFQSPDHCILRCSHLLPQQALFALVARNRR
jgi:hypothetical protein